jgi:hypothetical protein
VLRAYMALEATTPPMPTTTEPTPTSSESGGGLLLVLPPPPLEPSPRPSPASLAVGVGALDGVEPLRRAGAMWGCGHAGRLLPAKVCVGIRGRWRFSVCRQVKSTGSGACFLLDPCVGTVNTIHPRALMPHPT